MKQPVFHFYFKFFYFSTIFDKVFKIIPNSDSIIKEGNHKFFQTLKWWSQKGTVPCVIIVVCLTLQKFLLINLVFICIQNFKNEFCTVKNQIIYLYQVIGNF